MKKKKNRREKLSQLTMADDFVMTNLTVQVIIWSSSNSYLLTVNLVCNGAFDEQEVVVKLL